MIKTEEDMLDDLVETIVQAELIEQSVERELVSNVRETGLFLGNIRELMARTKQTIRSMLREGKI